MKTLKLVLRKVEYFSLFSPSFEAWFAHLCNRVPYYSRHARLPLSTPTHGHRLHQSLDVIKLYPVFCFRSTVTQRCATGVDGDGRKIHPRWSTSSEDKWADLQVRNTESRKRDTSISSPSVNDAAPLSYSMGGADSTREGCVHSLGRSPPHWQPRFRLNRSHEELPGCEGHRAEEDPMFSARPGGTMSIKYPSQLSRSSARWRAPGGNRR